MVAEASLYSEYYYCDAICREASTVVPIPISKIQKTLCEDAELSEKWSAYLAYELQHTRFRCELLSLKTVEERLLSWLNWNDGQLPSKGEWKKLASEIDVSP